MTTFRTKLTWVERAGVSQTMTATWVLSSLTVWG